MSDKIHVLLNQSIVEDPVQSLSGMMGRTWRTLFLILGVIVTSDVMLNGGARMRLGIVEASLSDSKTMVYSLPRPGVHLTEDGYTNLFYSDITRDVKIMRSLGVTTVMTFNDWKLSRPHSNFLNALRDQRMSIAVRFGPKSAASMQRDLEKLQKQLSDADVGLEFIFFDYEINFDTAADFFLWLRQVRTWMALNKFENTLLFIRWFTEVDDQTSIPNILEQWDKQPGFDGWVVDAYSTVSMELWSGFAAPSKGIFFLYGADAFNGTIANDDEEQAIHEENQAYDLNEMMD